MNRYIASSIISLICAQLIGCDYAWDGLNRDGTTKDFSETLARLGTPVENLECRMFKTTRDFSCSGKMTEEGFRKLSSILNLSHNEMTDFFGNKICAAKVLEGGGLLISTPNSRPKEIPGYEYLVAAFNAQTGEVCLESSNSYG